VIPNFNEFYPLDSQLPVLREVYSFNKTSKDLLEVLLSGTIGSSKTLTGIHAVVSHCLRFPGAKAGIGRRALPRLKDTVCSGIVQHLYETGVPFKYNETRGDIKLSNGSHVVPFSWSDKNFKKFRSYELSCYLLEEATENEDEYKDCYFEAVQRIRSNIPERWAMAITNPGDPGHWIYKHFYLSQKSNRMVFESTAANNPYLPEGYIENLREILDPKQAERMLDGKWISLTQEVIYYAYDRAKNFKNESYAVDIKYPIFISFDFNIGVGKPFSVCFIQYINGKAHVFNEVVIEGQRTLDAMDEMWERKLLSYPTSYVVNGDAAGRNRDTRSRQTDYSLIENFLSNVAKIKFKMDVPTTNPRIRDRHLIVNGRICNSNGERNLFVYKDAPTVDEGLRLTSLKKNGEYIEDDSKSYQHITTALGYSIMQNYRETLKTKSEIITLPRF
jgi:hypothetical protein